MGLSDLSNCLPSECFQLWTVISRLTNFLNYLSLQYSADHIVFLWLALTSSSPFQGKRNFLSPGSLILLYYETCFLSAVCHKPIIIIVNRNFSRVYSLSSPEQFLVTWIIVGMPAFHYDFCGENTGYFFSLFRTFLYLLSTQIESLE